MVDLLVTYEHAFESNGIQIADTMSYAKHFITRSVAISLTSHSLSKNKKTTDKAKGILSSWKEAVKHQLKMYATDDVIVKTKMGMQNFNTPPSMMPNQYADIS